jgi:phage terminase large subunit-like protein
MRWMISNVTIERDAQDRMRPSKRKSQEKIDGVSALANAANRAIAEQETPPSVYETRGVLFVEG